MRKGMHGGDWAAYQAKHEALPLLDFSANVSPLGPPEGVKQALREAVEDVARYPDPNCRALRRALGEYHGIEPDQILCGSGAADLIDRLALALRPKRALVMAPTFSEYAEALERVGCQITSFHLREEDGFAVTPEILDAITPDLDVLFLCEPNNPTGRTTEPGLFQEILKTAHAGGVLVVLDECFAPFLDHQRPVLPSQSVLVLRAFTKFYGLAGVRLGYCLCADTDLLERMALAGQPWSVSNLAQAAGIAALRETAYAERLRALIRDQRPWLKRELERLGCLVLPGEANYLLFRSPVPRLHERLERKGILIRPCADYDGLGESWFRISVRTAEENQRLIQTMEGLFMTKNIMIQGTMSGVGKSLLTAALCRIFRQDGYRVAPFKSQNMALNSYITQDGLEMGRAQVVQARAAGKEPDVRMNPILLKPSSDVGSQLIVHGKVRGDYRAADYFKMKKSLIPEVLAAYDGLARENDILVIEGAGSPAEINLKQDDIVNMGLAKLVDAPVLLVGDIDRGGVFAQLYGTLELLEPDERARVAGCVINKFRGDVDLLKPGLTMLEEKTHVPVLGVVPYTEVELEEEDSLAPCLEQTEVTRPIDVAVIRFPRISNFTDFTPLERHPALGVRYVSKAEELGQPDLLILPGTKSTMEDLLWIRQNGIEAVVKRLADAGTPVLGICGGYQMLGQTLSDPYGVEKLPMLFGLGLLPCETEFLPKKTRTRVAAQIVTPLFAGVCLDGYEIHMGATKIGVRAAPFCRLSNGQDEGAVAGNIFGTYLHGLFDSGELTEAMARWLLIRKGLDPVDFQPENQRDYQDRQLDLLADVVRKSLDMTAIYAALEGKETP